MNSRVNAHSAAVRAGPYRARTAATLSSMTTATLARMAQISTRSNARPVGVSDSNTTS